MPRAFPHRGVLSLTPRTLMPYVMVVCLLLLPMGGSTAATYAGGATTNSAPTVVTAGTVGEVAARSYLLDVRPSVRKQVRRINRVRGRNGVDPVRLHRCLTDDAAQPWARRMAKTGDFRHQELSDVQKKCPRFGWMGENIAYGYPTVSTVMEAWMASSGHRANILRPQFTHVGIGVKRDASGRRYWVQNFGG
jgi:uncharacterized protein YkwD